MTTYSQTEANKPTSSQSEDLSAIKAERVRLQNKLFESRSNEDWANKWYLNLTLAAVVAAGGFGIAAFVFQRSAQRSSGSSRENSDLLEKSEARERLILETSTALALERAGEANKLAEAEALKRVKLEQKIAPRRLTVEQQKRIGGMCAAMYGKPVLVASYMLDPESAALAEQLVSTLRSAYIRVEDRIAEIGVNGIPDTGIAVRGPASEDAFTSCLGHALNTAGGLVVTVNGPSTSDPKGVLTSQSTIFFGKPRRYPGGALPEDWPVVIFVGVKPIPSIGNAE